MTLPAEPFIANDVDPNGEALRREVVRGLTAERKRTPPKFLYDRKGSRLFDQICELDEYYVTRTELGIMEKHGQEMVELLGPGCLMIEFGSGSSLKTRILLNHMEDLTAYVPLDISAAHLMAAARELDAAYPDLRIIPVCADFTQPMALPEFDFAYRRRVIYFPGSTIGNFEPEQARRFLQQAHAICGAGGALLIGVDLIKDRKTLQAAYNDRSGVTADFNLNLLDRVNRELGGDFDRDAFRHDVRFNEELRRVEMHIKSLRDQRVRLDGTEIDFARGETIHTESSHKYDLERFSQMAEVAGFVVSKVWTDENRLFSVQYLVSQ